MSWPKLPLDQLGYVSRGRSRHRPRNDPTLYGGPYPFIQTGDVKHANFRITEHTATYSEAGLAQSRLWPKDTLCITIAANIAAQYPEANNLGVSVLIGTGLVLFLITFVVNFIARKLTEKASA